MDTVLRTEGLTKRYKGVVACNDISMTIERGDIYGFIGRNGAGKTTFMRLVLSLAIPDAGSIILFDGEDPKSAGQKMGSIIEAPSLYGGCSALENLRRFSLLDRKRNKPASDKELNELIELVGLSDAGNKRAGSYSLGMKQRLGLAVAMLGDPQFLIMDEPVNGLDPSGIRDMRDAIKQLNQERQVTFLISSHLLDELSRTVTKYGIINDGVLLEEITAKELENMFRKNISITVNDPSKAYDLLKTFLHIKEMEVQDNTLIIYSHEYEPAALNRILVNSGLLVSSLTNQSGDIEDFFIKRIGGMR